VRRVDGVAAERMRSPRSQVNSLPGIMNSAGRFGVDEQLDEPSAITMTAQHQTRLPSMACSESARSREASHSSDPSG
jgi:hypothetical protein